MLTVKTPVWTAGLYAGFGLVQKLQAVIGNATSRWSYKEGDHDCACSLPY